MEEKKKKKERLDIMIDLETLGSSEGSIILSVAMKAFRLDGAKPVKDFCYSQHISVLSSLMQHLHSDFATEEWWAKQSEDAKTSLFEGQKNALQVGGVMRLIHDVLQTYNDTYQLYLWGRGVGSYDLPILDSVMKKVVGEGYKTPWNYWAAMDVRSVVGFCKECGMETERANTPHDAMADVEKQIVEVQTCWQYVRVERAV